MIRTHEGAKQYEHALDHSVEFFSKAGSLYVNKGSYYEGEETALGLFQKAWIVDKAEAMKLLFWLRDCRGGAGNRSGFRACLNWLADNGYFDWVIENLPLIPKYGRWDDLRFLYKTPAEKMAAGFWTDALKHGDVLAAKWCDRKKDYPLRKHLGMNEAEFRKLIAKIRKYKIVEHKMCQKQWYKILYGQVPSVAMARYTNAFNKHDAERFAAYKEALNKGEAKVKAATLFPHDCVRTARSGDRAIANHQFMALPNYMEGTDERIMVIADTSGSMDTTLSGSIRAVDVSQAIALYCSDKIPTDNPFHRKYMIFSKEGNFISWKGYSFSEAVRELFVPAVGPTFIGAALIGMLQIAHVFNLKQEQLPSMILIVSDMQFHESQEFPQYGLGYSWEKTNPNDRRAEVQRALDQYRRSGYTPPKVVFWNVAGYAGQPAHIGMPVGLVSGFSPSILKAVLGGQDFTPRGIMLRAISKYEITVPASHKVTTGDLNENGFGAETEWRVF